MPLGPETALLSGRAAVVTGAAAGIGRATAQALARFGAAVALCDRDEAGLGEVADAVEAGGGDVLAGVLDVRDADAVAAFVADAGERHGTLHVLVNNAGGGFESAFLDLSPGGRQAIVRENFDSVVHFVREVVPYMSAGGSIVNVTSVEAHRAAPGFAVYAAQKAAVANLTMSLALELGDRNIRVNCVAPDLIPTPGIGPLSPPPKTPLAVMAAPDDVAAAIVFLAGDLSRFVTGSTIHVDGGTAAAGGWHRRPDGTWST